MSITHGLTVPGGLANPTSVGAGLTTPEGATRTPNAAIPNATAATPDSFARTPVTASEANTLSATRPELALAPAEARVATGATPTSPERTATPVSNTASETNSAEGGESGESFWTWKNILPKVLIAIGTATLVVALFNTVVAAPAIFKANGVLMGLVKTGGAFIGNLGQALLYVVVTPFVAAYEALRFTVIGLKDVIIAGARLLGQGIANTATFVWNNILVPTAKFVAPAAKFIWENVVVKAAVLIKDVVVWSFQNVIRPVFEFIGPALKFVWENVVVKFFDTAFWAIGKVFEGAFNVLSFVYQNALVPVSRVIRATFSAIGNALAPAARWVFSNILAPVGNAIATAAVASYQYVIKPVGMAIGSVLGTVGSAIGSAASAVASGIASAWRAVANTIGAVFA